MKEKVKDFIEKYNKMMDWDKDIIEHINLNLFPNIKDFIDEYIHPEKITEENYDIEHAEVYSYESGTLELQAISNESFRRHYFWVKPEEDIDEMKYKEGRIKFINEKINECLEELNKLVIRRDEFVLLREMLNPIKL